MPHPPSHPLPPSCHILLTPCPEAPPLDRRESPRSQARSHHASKANRFVLSCRIDAKQSTMESQHLTQPQGCSQMALCQLQME